MLVLLVLKVTRRLTLIQKRGLCQLRLPPLMTEFSVFMPLQGIAPGNSWLGGVSLKDYKDGENKTQRLYWCCSNYALSKLIVDSGLEHLWRRENQNSPDFTGYGRSFGKDPGKAESIIRKKLLTIPRLIT